MLALAASITVFAAQSAAADDGRRHVMTPTQKIDLVRDLPNDATFERDGQYFDLGYIYPIHTVNGASVASTGGDAGFVLYHDDRYARLNAGDVAELRFTLGEDPTEGYIPPVTASSSASSPAAWGADYARRPSAGDGSSPASESALPARRSGKLGWFGFIVIVAMGGAIHWFRRTLRRAVVREMQGGWESHRHAKDSEPFDARVSARLSELQSGDVAPAPAGYQPPATPVVRGFGRKGA
jgi:hypothetical protein